jgi:predicted nucleotidyltransferase
VAAAAVAAVVEEVAVAEANAMDNPVSGNAEASVDRIAGEMARAFGDALVSVTLYGSVARGTTLPGIADVNLLIVLREVSLDTLASLRKVLGSREDCRVTPYLLTHQELPQVVEAFPTRFLEMKRGYRVLSGQDVLAGLQIDKKVLESRARQELLNILLRFRHAMLGSTEAGDLERDLQAFLQPLLKVLRSLVCVRTDQHIESRRELILSAARQFAFESDPLLQLSNWRSGKVMFTGNEWDQAAAAFFTILQQISRKLDG